MRIPGRKIWRAFKELDQFSDEQCARFVKRARGGWIPRIALSLFVAGVFGATFLGLLIAMIRVHTSLGLDKRSDYSDSFIAWTTAGGILIVGTIAPMLALLLRDFILRAAIWRVLNLGGVCQACHYPLHGLPLPVSLECPCPECGHVTKVDRALVELARNNDGELVASRRPGDSYLSIFWTQKRIRLAKRVFIAIFVVLIVLPISLLLCNELLIRIEAARASARRPTLDQLRAAMPSVTSAEAGASERELSFAFALGASIEASWNKHSNEYARELLGGSQSVGSEELSVSKLLALPPRPRGPLTSLGSNEATREQRKLEPAEEVLRRVQGEGVLDRLLELGRMDPEPAPVYWNAALRHRTYYLWNRFQECRIIAIARCRQAAADGDLGSFEKYLRVAINTLRFDYCNRSLEDYMIAGREERVLWDELLTMVDENPAIIEATERVLRDMPLEPSWAAMLRAEKLWAEDAVLATIADPDLVRFNRFTPALRARYSGWPQGVPPGRIGWVGENVETVGANFDALIRHLESPPRNRLAFFFRPSSLLLTGGVLPRAAWIIPVVDVGAAERASLPVVLAIERYRRDHGSLPDSLDEGELLLAPNQKTDPLSGKPWRYIPRPTATPTSLRSRGGYLLYSVGPDGVDDFARTSDPTIFVRVDARYGASALEGRDILLNPAPMTAR
jgi:hypothetical protein